MRLNRPSKQGLQVQVLQGVPLFSVFLAQFLPPSNRAENNLGQTPLFGSLLAKTATFYLRISLT